jgi:hypothetical protein
MGNNMLYLRNYRIPFDELDAIKQEDIFSKFQYADKQFKWFYYIGSGNIIRHIAKTFIDNAINREHNNSSLLMAG